MEAALSNCLGGNLSQLGELIVSAKNKQNSLASVRALHHTLCLVEPDFTAVKSIAGKVASPSVITFALSLQVDSKWNRYGTPLKFAPTSAPACFTHAAMKDTDVQCLSIAQVVLSLYALYWVVPKMDPLNVSTVVQTLRARVGYFVNCEELDWGLYDSPEFTEGEPIDRSETKRVRGREQVNVRFLGVCDALITCIEAECIRGIPPDFPGPMRCSSVAVAWIRGAIKKFKENVLVAEYQKMEEQMMCTRALSRAFQIRMGAPSVSKPRSVLLSISDTLVPAPPASQRALTESTDVHCIDILFLLATRAGSVGDMVKNGVVFFERPQKCVYPCIYRVRVGGYGWVVASSSLTCHLHKTLVGAVLSLNRDRLRGCNFAPLIHGAKVDHGDALDSSLF
jgi:hypothetical protein